MSSSTTSYAAGILTTQFDYAKCFFFANRFRTGQYTNGTGSSVDLAAGTILGTIFSSNKLTPQVSTATDGSQVPVGILANNVTVANGATVTLTYCWQGDVDTSQLTFGGSDTLATTISLTDSGTDTVIIGTIESILVSKGINPQTVVDNTIADN